MSTQTTSVPSEERQQRRRRTWPVVVAAAVLAALVGLGSGYLLFAPGPTDEVPAEVEQLLTDYWAAASDGDADAIFGMLTEDAQFFPGVGSPPNSLSVLRSVIEGWADVPIELVGDPILIGGEGWYHVAQLGIFGGEETMGRYDYDEYLYVMRLEEQDGVLKIDYISHPGLY